MNRQTARLFSYSFTVLATSLAVGSACAPTYKGAGTESVNERAGRCLDAGTDTKVATWLKGRQVQLCKKCAVEYPTNADGTQGECPNPEKNLQSWQEVYETEQDLIDATVLHNEICSQNPHAMPFPNTKKVFYVRALGANNYPAPADTPCAGEDIVRFDPSKPVGAKPGAAPTGPVVGAPPAAAPMTTAPVTTAPVTTAPVTTAPVTTAPVTTAPVTTAPVTTAPATTAPVTTAPVTTAPATTAPAASAAGTGSMPGWVAVPSIAPKFTFVVKSGVNTYIKADHRQQAAQLSDAQKCLLKSNETVPVSAYSTSSSGGRNITITLLQAKCGFAAGASAFIYADHFQTLPAGLFK